MWPPELRLRASLVRAEDELRRGVAADLSPPAQQNLCDYLTICDHLYALPQPSKFKTRSYWAQMTIWRATTSHRSI